MARRARSASSAPTGRPRTGLDHPFPSSPSHPPRFALYCKNKYGAKTVQSFRAAYAAKRFLDTVTQGSPIKWLNCATIEAENGVIISSTTSSDPKPADFKHFDMEEIIEHEDNEDEAAWETPYPQADQWAMFPVSTGERPERGEYMGNGAERPTRAAKPVREKRPQRVEGNVTVGALAERMGIEATKARAALRKAGEQKPPQGWEWAPSELDRIQKVIKANLK